MNAPKVSEVLARRIGRLNREWARAKAQDPAWPVSEGAGAMRRRTRALSDAFIAAREKEERGEG